MSCLPFGKCPEITCADITSFSLQNIDNTGENPILQENDSIPAIAFALKLDFTTIEQSCVYTKNIDYSLTNKLFALSCNDSRLINNIEKVSIFSTIDFDANHPKDTVLNDLFINIGDIEKKILKEEDIYFYLDNQPEIEQESRFIVNIELADGALFSDTTDTVILTR